MHTPYVIVSEKYQMMMSLCKAFLTALAGFSLLCLTQIASSAPIDVRHAQKIASEHLQRVRPLRAEVRKVKLLRTNKGLPTRGEKQADYYVFGALQGEGWVLVAGDDALPPVLAYATKGEFPEELHPEFASVLDKYQHLVKQARLHTGGMQKSPILSPTEEIKPLLDKIHWSQHRPYNQLLPIRTNPKTGEPVQAPTGCGATAIAQVMRYHAWPPKGRGSVTYLGKTIDFAQELPYAWTEMLGRYIKGKYSDAQGEAVARLMHDVGYAAHMKYGAFESGAPPRAMFEALRRYFNYAPTLRYYVISHHSLAESLRILIDELKAGRPVPMDGSTIYNAPHAFVCDGYDGQGLFHINWGWGGDADGYFLIHSVETGNGGGKESYYNLVYGMLIGMQSPARVPNAKEMKEFHCTQALQITTGRFSKKELLTCNVAGIVNQAYSPVVGIHAVILKDADGKQIHQAHDTSKPFLLKGGQERFRIGKVEIDPKPLKLGKYYLRPAVYDRVDKEYVEATQDPTQKLFSITVTENDVIVAEEEAKPQLSFEVTPTTAPLGEMTTFHLKIANSGTQPYICPIALTLSESQNAPEITDPKTLPFLSWMRIDPGTTEGRTFAIKMPSAGTQHYIHFYYTEKNNGYYCAKLPWYNGKTVYVPKEHHSSQRLTLAADTEPSAYAIQQLSVTNPIRQGERFKMEFEVSVPPSAPNLTLQLTAGFTKVVDGATSPVAEMELPIISVLSGQKKRFSIEKVINFDPGSNYQLFVYKGFTPIPELMVPELTVQAGSPAPSQGSEVPVPTYDALPQPFLTTVHKPVVENTEGGKCKLYEIDTKERLLAEGEQIPRETLIGLSIEPEAGYEVKQWTVEGATYLADESYGDGTFTFVGKIYKVTGNDLRVNVVFQKKEEGTLPPSPPDPLPTDLVELSYVDHHDARSLAGSHRAETYHVALHVPPTSYLVGTKVRAVKAYLRALNGVATHTTLWMSRTLPNRPEEAEYWQHLDLSTLDLGDTEELHSPGKLNTIPLTKGYTIPPEGVYLGLSFTITTEEQEVAKKPIVLAEKKNVRAEYWTRCSESLPTWTLKKGTKIPAMSLLLEKEGILEQAVQPVECANAVAEIGKLVPQELLLENAGRQNITRFTYKLDDEQGNQLLPTTAVQLKLKQDEQIAFGQTVLADIHIKGAQTTGQQNCRVTITHVNEHTINLVPTTVCYANVLTIAQDKKFVRNALVEDFTATTAGDAPAGHAARKLLRETFGRRLVGIAIHTLPPTDPMAVPQDRYPDPCQDHTTPILRLNRREGKLDPIYMKEKVERELQKPALVDIALKPTWKEDKKQVEILATINTYVDGEYQIAYALVADNLHSEQENWQQHNNFYNEPPKGEGDPLDNFRQGGTCGAPRYKQVYEDVLLASSYLNHKNTVKPILLEIGHTTTSECTLERAMRKDLELPLTNAKYYVVGIVTNSEGEVMNAVKVALDPNDPVYPQPTPNPEPQPQPTPNPTPTPDPQPQPSPQPSPQPPQGYLLTVNVTGKGTVTTSPAGKIPAGTRVMLTVLPAQDYRLASIKVLNNDAPVTESVLTHESTTESKTESKTLYSLLMPSHPVVVYALFEKNVTPVEENPWTEITVEPNPCTTYLRISNYKGVNSAKYTLIGLMGRIERFGVIKAPETTLDLTDLPAGLYLLYLEASDGARKLVKVVHQ